MKYFITKYPGIVVASIFLLGFGLPKSIEKRMVKEIEKTFEIEDFTLKSIIVPSETNAELPTKISGDNLFMVVKDEKLLGYAFTDQAPSKTAQFDYLVIFSEDLKIINSKILIYREEYGGEIGSKRWLKQFLGKKGGDRVSEETNIDAISGATISVRSMTKSVDKLLQTIALLQEKEVL